MLSKADNELLTRVGPGTGMGNLLRCFWQPFALSSELPEPGGEPKAVRLLGEDLVARRAEDGTVHLSPYQAREAGGVIWAHLGSPASDLPQLEWTLVPDRHRYVSKRIQFCNFLQNVEGEVDSSHVSFLHSRNDPTAVQEGRGGEFDYMARDRAPRFFVLPTPYGLMISARRDADPDSYYWRITQFLMPTYTMIPATPGGPVSFTAAVPIDDERMMGFTVTWHPDRPLSDEERAAIESWQGVHTEVDPRTFIPLRNKDNNYLLDRALQRSGRSYTGIRGIREEDLAVQESMGVIFDRTIEHLGSSDLGVIATRRRLLDAVNVLAEQHQLPYEAQHPESYRVRSAAVVLPRHIPWHDGAADAMLVGRIS
ncbi:MAG TPA: aromatic ring-hydroxylating dioxygenase subunit alpha [Chloroflexota bacterium]